MNPETQKKIDAILSHVQSTERDELARHIAGCNFTDATDPLLNILLTLAMIGAQPLKIANASGALVATESGLARLGDRLDEKFRAVQNLKWRNVILSWVICAALGVGTTVLTTKLWPDQVNRALHVPPVVDSRLVRLGALGAVLQVREINGETQVFFSGDRQPVSGYFPDGTKCLLFPGQPQE